MDVKRKKQVSFVDLVKDKKDKKGDDKKDSNFRDKKKEFQKHLRLLEQKLSSDVLETIKNNPEKIDEIIEGLRKKVSLEGYDPLELEKFINKIKKKYLSK